MKTSNRSLEWIQLTDGRPVAVEISPSIGFAAFVQQSELIEWTDIAERTGRIRSLPPDSLAPIMVTIRGPTSDHPTPPQTRRAQIDEHVAVVICCPQAE